MECFRIGIEPAGHAKPDLVDIAANNRVLDAQAFKKIQQQNRQPRWRPEEAPVATAEAMNAFVQRGMPATP